MQFTIILFTLWEFRKVKHENWGNRKAERLKGLYLEGDKSLIHQSMDLRGYCKRIESERDKYKELLIEIRSALTKYKCDTLWLTDTETVFDAIDRVLKGGK